jgi:hypothetical protein
MGQERSAVTYVLRFTSLLFVVLALVPAGAHLCSMISKLRLGHAEYLAAQRAYDGWSLFGIVVFGALILLFALAVRLYRSGEPYWLTVMAFLCIAGTQAVFWLFTFPANRATDNWTVLPEGWEAIRLQWEYSHAASAILNFIALVAMLFSIIRTN